MKKKKSRMDNVKIKCPDCNKAMKRKLMPVSYLFPWIKDETSMAVMSCDCGIKDRAPGGRKKK